uniref:Uncharacterized protein n=1 Tax=mine drainage metagenome TaxID=410659 RepID=E6PW56_9ZZZZ
MSECKIRLPAPITADRACNFWPASEGSITLLGAYLGAYSEIDFSFSHEISEIGDLFDSPPLLGACPGRAKARFLSTMNVLVAPLRWQKRRAHDERISLRRPRAGTIPDTSRTQE